MKNNFTFKNLCFFALVNISTIAFADPCKVSDSKNFGGKIIILGDSFAEGMQNQIMFNWSRGTLEDSLLGEEAPHISQIQALGRKATGLNLPVEGDKYWPDIFNLTILNNNFVSNDIAIIWLGTNDNQSIKLTDKDQKKNSKKKSKFISKENEDRWWEIYMNRLLQIGKTCVTKKLDCYWFTPTNSLGEDRHANRMSDIRDLLLEFKNVEEYKKHITVLDMWTLRENYPGNDWAHPSPKGFKKAFEDLNSKIFENRGFDLSSLSQKIRTCRQHNK